jgi:hypothetical protein
MPSNCGLCTTYTPLFTSDFANQKKCCIPLKKLNLNYNSQPEAYEPIFGFEEFRG